MRRLLLATTNPSKLREIRDLLTDVPFELVGLDTLPPLPAPEETGQTFDENARLKALAYDRDNRCCHLTVAEDSGLVVDALGGAPGVHSARFLRPDATYAERFTEIYRVLDENPNRPRTARFICAVAVARNGQVVYESRGVVEGEIARPPRGTAGFGYDPIFFYPPYRCTLAEVTQASKLRVAHRGQAFRTLAQWLRTENGE